MNNVNNNAQMALFITNQWLLTLEAEKQEALQVTSKSCKQCTLYSTKASPLEVVTLRDVSNTYLASLKKNPKDTFKFQSRTGTSDSPGLKARLKRELEVIKPDSCRDQILSKPTSFSEGSTRLEKSFDTSIMQFYWDTIEEIGLLNKTTPYHIKYINRFKKTNLI